MTDHNTVRGALAVQALARKWRPMSFNDLIGQFLRLSLTVQNVLTFTNYEGLDPEIFDGIDRNIYPRPRTIVFGVNVEF